MKDDKKPASMQDVDRSLSTPSEANREKHINVRDDENNRNKNPKDLTDRQKQWQEDVDDSSRNENQSDDIY